MLARRPLASAAAAGRAVLLLSFTVFAPWQVLTAQVPPGWVAVSAFQDVGTAPGGVFLLHPSIPGPMLTITGLGADLTGNGGTVTQGAGSILVDRSGNLVVGEHAPLAQGTVDIHLITLSGTAVASSVVHTIGQLTNFGSIDQMAWLGDDIVFCNRGGNVSGPMAAVHVGILRPSVGPPGAPGTLIPVPFTSNPSGTTNALCVDPQGQNAYLAKTTGVSPSSSTSIYRVPLSFSGTPVIPVQVAFMPGTALSLTFDNDGTMLVGLYPNPGGSPLYRIDLTWNPPLVTPLASTMGPLNALEVEGPTGALLGADFGTTQPSIVRFMAGGSGIVLATFTSAPSGLAVNPSLRTFGVPTPGANSYTWAIAPNAGGVPMVGNAGFRLNVRSAPGTAPGLLGLSLGQNSLMLGFKLLLDPATLVLHGVVPAQPLASVPVPIPASTMLTGLRVFAQTLHLEPALASSAGLEITIF